MKASELDPIRYPNFPEFARFGIPLDLVDAAVVLILQRLRELSEIPITPSPVHGGWARTTGSSESRHYAVGRLADAGDVFPARGRLLECWVRAQEMWRIGALGLYSDTNGPDGKPWCMMHFDLRKVSRRVFWVREEGVYYYLHRNPKRYWEAFANIQQREGGR